MLQISSADEKLHRYLSPDPHVMEGVLDEDGFYKTGDLVRREGSDYFMLGRASQDSKSFPPSILLHSLPALSSPHVEFIRKILTTYGE